MDAIGLHRNSREVRRAVALPALAPPLSQPRDHVLVHEQAYSLPLHYPPTPHTTHPPAHLVRMHQLACSPSSPPLPTLFLSISWSARYTTTPARQGGGGGGGGGGAWQEGLLVFQCGCRHYMPATICPTQPHCHHLQIRAPHVRHTPAGPPNPCQPTLTCVVVDAKGVLQPPRSREAGVPCQPAAQRVGQVLRVGGVGGGESGGGRGAVPCLPVVEGEVGGVGGCCRGGRIRRCEGG